MLQTDEQIIQLKQLQLDYTALIISILVNALIVGLMFKHSRQASKIIKNNNKVRYAELISDFDREFIEHEKKEHTFQKPIEIIDYTIHYINISHRLAHLFKENLIDKKIIEYFHPNLEKGLALLCWLEKIKENQYDTNWKSLRAYCKNNDLPPDENEIESIIEEYQEKLNNSNV